MRKEDDDLEMRVIRFASETSGICMERLHAASRLQQDCGVTGDDATELMVGFSRKFSVDLSEFRFGKHFGPEGVNLFGETRKFTEVMVHDLVLAARAGKWPSDVEGDMKGKSLRDALVEMLRRVEYLRIRPTKGTGVFLIKEAWAFWNRRKSDDEKRELLRCLFERLPRAVLLLDPMDDDILQELSALEGVERRVHALILPSGRVLDAWKSLYCGNWLLLLFPPGAIAGVPPAVAAEPEALSAMLAQVNASAAIVSLPDDTEWLLAVRDDEVPV